MAVVSARQKGSGATASERGAERVVRDAPLTIGREELLSDGNDDKFRELVHDLFALASRHEEVRRGHAAMIGLSAPQYTLLISAAHLGGHAPVSIRELAAHLRVKPAFVTMETNKLQRLGLLVKPRSRHDSRVAEVSVTEKGYELLEELSTVQRQVNDKQFANLNRSDFDELHRLVRLLIDDSDRAIALQAYLRSTAAPAEDGARAAE